MTDDWLEGGDDPTIVDKHDLARFTGLSLKQIEGGCREGMPTHGMRRRGEALKFNMPEVIQWLLVRNADPLNDAKTRSARAVARKRELEVEKLEARFGDVEEIARDVRNRIAKLQSDLLAIPARCPPETQELVRAAIVESVNELAAGQ